MQNSRFLIQVNHEDLILNIEYAEPFDTILNPAIFVVKSEFEKAIQNIQTINDGQRVQVAHICFVNQEEKLN